MKKDVIQRFEKKQVKLVLDNDFVLYGKITEIFDDCVIFLTAETESVIETSSIKQITLKG
jgi:sRNA-binding regulator protein Hfq